MSHILIRRTAAAVAAAVALAACQGAPTSPSDNPGTSPSGTSATDRPAALETSIFDLETGDCFSIDDPGDISTIRVVPCDEPHVYEAFAVVEHPAGDGDPYPGDDATLEFSEAACRDEFASYVGVAYEESELYITSVYPSRATWSLGDRAIACTLRAEDESELSGSARGSGR